MVDLTLIPLTGNVGLTVIPPDQPQIQRGRVGIETTDGRLRAWKRRNLVAEGTPTSIVQTNARLVEVWMEDGTQWLLSLGCGCGGK